MLYKYSIRPSDVDSRLYERTGYVKADSKVQAVQRVCMAQDVEPESVSSLVLVESKDRSDLDWKGERK